ncbi:hypothetical protein [Prochlorococcus marinus]|uniref:hypothetical protein n=1 Tax=Prochlorococcus marinus TaxID=1219 RepID=UPI0022B548E2|nr:hypothetical protein [Prochlorococcus marinus]
MNKDIKILIPYINTLFKYIHGKKFHFNLVLLSGLLLVPLQQTRSEELFLKCVGKYEINRGPLIKPDWETSYLTINLDGLISTIYDKGIKKEGRTMIRRNSYTITHRDNRNSVKNIYKINGNHGTYSVESPQRNRTLIGTCQKGRG